MGIGKWNYDTHSYDAYSVPKLKYPLGLFSQDMEAKISCAGCFKTMTYGESYTSREIHNYMGLGYGVCEDCYELELKRQKEAKK